MMMTMKIVIILLFLGDDDVNNYNTNNINNKQNMYLTNPAKILTGDNSQLLHLFREHDRFLSSFILWIDTCRKYDIIVFA